MTSPLSPEILAQHAALTSGCGLVDLGHRAQIELTGSDRAEFLHKMCTNDISALVPGNGCEAFLTNAQGKILGYVFVFCRDGSLELESVAGQAPALIEHLDRYLFRDDVKLNDLSRRRCELLLGGAESADVLRLAGQINPPDRPMSHIDAAIDGKNVSIRSVGLTGDASWLIACAQDDASAVSQALQAAGAMSCGEEAFEIARVEAGAPFYGRDLSDQNLPQEVARGGRAVSFTKGCYIGQETVARIDALGHVNRLLAGVRFAASHVPPAGTELTVGEKAVGQVTSAVYSARAGAPLALAYVRRIHAKPGAMLESSFGTGEVVALPI